MKGAAVLLRVLVLAGVAVATSETPAAPPPCKLSLLKPHKGFKQCEPPPPPPTLTRSTMIGMALASSAAGMNAAGLNVQRYASSRGPSHAALNILGVVMSASCGLLDMASFSFAAQSLLAPFGALTLVLNLLAAPLHGDAIGLKDYASTALVFAGVATCLANANTEEVERTYDSIVQLTRRTPFHAWVALLVVGLSIAALHLRTAPAGAHSAAVCFPLLAGGLGGCTTLCAKLTGELAKAQAPWLVGAGVGCLIPVFAISQLTLLNAGLARASSLLIVPVFVATFVTVHTLPLTTPHSVSHPRHTHMRAARLSQCHSATRLAARSSSTSLAASARRSSAPTLWASLCSWAACSSSRDGRIQRPSSRETRESQVILFEPDFWVLLCRERARGSLQAADRLVQ